MYKPSLVAMSWCPLASECWIIKMSIINISVCSVLVSVWAAAQTVPLPSSEASPPQPSQRSLPHSESSPDPGLQTHPGSARHDAPGGGTQACGQSLGRPPSQSSQVGKHTANTLTVKHAERRREMVFSVLFTKIKITSVINTMGEPLCSSCCFTYSNPCLCSKVAL